MSTRAEIDEMLRRLEERLPEWAEVYPEHQFLAMLGQSLDYIAYSADPDARRHCLIRTGCLHPGSCEREHARRYRR
ncbi:hypothetical protein A7X60_02725 [Stenotrophomonas maltophilia]|nr:hypothetical protein A7X60_02725 [Stenotrophomonas maltophilia]